jgi:hypothetical protein
MKQYLLSVHYVEGQEPPPPETIEQMFKDVDALNQEIKDAGAWIFAGGLEQPQIATVVREAGGQIVRTDGPFAEAKEHIGGFWVIAVDDHDAALAWAEQATRACLGPVEVRPFQDDVED